MIENSDHGHPEKCHFSSGIRKILTLITAGNNHGRGIPIAITGYLLWKRIKGPFRLYG
jgi:hypothetical protein